MIHLTNVQISFCVETRVNKILRQKELISDYLAFMEIRFE